MIDVEQEDAVAYAAPATVEDVLALLGSDSGAKLIAGGQSLFVFMRQGLLDPSLLIGLRGVAELHQFDLTEEGEATIGAMVTQHALACSELLGRRFPALAEAALAVASPLIRRQGTIGGNLCHADPTGDPPAALIALGAEIEIASPVGRRRVPAEAFFVDYMETMLAEGELLVRIHLPEPARQSGSAYIKHRLRGIDTALVGAAAAITLSADRDRIEDARIGLVGAATTPMRAVAAESLLIGAAPTGGALALAAAAAAGECEPLGDTEGSEQYRRDMVAVFVRRAAERAIGRARRTLA